MTSEKLDPFMEQHPEEIRNPTGQCKAMMRVEAHRACKRFGSVKCDALATLVSDLSFGSLEQSRRDTASLPIWEDGHPSQMTFFTSSRTGNSAHHISFRHRHK